MFKNVFAEMYFNEFSSDEGLCAETCLQNKEQISSSFKILSFLYSTSAAGFVYVFYENAKAALFHTIKVDKSSFRKDKKKKKTE